MIKTAPDWGLYRPWALLTFATLWVVLNGERKVLLFFWKYFFTTPHLKICCPWKTFPPQAHAWCALKRVLIWTFLAKRNEQIFLSTFEVACHICIWKFKIISCIGYTRVLFVSIFPIYSRNIARIFVEHKARIAGRRAFRVWLLSTDLRPPSWTPPNFFEMSTCKKKSGKKIRVPRIEKLDSCFVLRRDRL